MDKTSTPELSISELTKSVHDLTTSQIKLMKHLHILQDANITAMRSILSLREKVAALEAKISQSPDRRI